MRPLTLTLAALVAALGHAQQHAFRQLTARDGLAQSQVRAMSQDGRGYLWVGTLGGASRFDGVTFQNRSLQDGLPDAQVSAMACDREGRLWMGTGNMLARVDGNRLITEPVPGADKGSRILGLIAGADGDLYIGTDGGGLHVRDAGGTHPFPGYPSDTATHVRALHQLRDGSLLVGLRNGLLHCSASGCRAVPVGDAEPKLVSAVEEAADGSWWVGTLGSGLYRIAPDGRLLAEFDEETGLLQNNVRCLLIDDRDRLWVGTKLGLNQYDGQRLRTFTVHQGLPNDNIQCAFQDHEGNIWFGTDGAGVLLYLGDRFVTFTVKDGLCSDQVMSVTPDSRGDLWLGTYDNGLCRLDGMAMITTLDGLPNNTIWSGLLAQDGTMWFGTSDGLARVVNGVVERPQGEAPLAGSRVFALHQDPSGRIWCGTREGLFSLAPDGSTTTAARGAGAPQRSVRAIIGLPDGTLELAGDDGCYRYRNGSFLRIGESEGLCDETALCLLRDQAGRTWVGTANGLSCLKDGGARCIRMAQDFGSNYIDFLIADEHGLVWAGTNNGLFRFHPDSLLADSSAYTHITLSDGLRGLEFNLNAAHAWTKGRLLFGSASGTVLHSPLTNGHAASDPVPRVHITGVRSFLQPSAWKDACDSLDADGLPAGLHLSYRRHYLTFDYTAVAFNRPEQVRFRYRLTGLDPDWLPATEARFASFSNLPHGDYTFEVMAAVGNGPWSAPATFSFRIDPPYWARWWFFAACAAAAAALAWGIHRIRTQRRERRERTRQLVLRSRMLQLEQQALNANMNRHFVFNALNSIQFHINRQDRATASRYLTSFAKLIRKNLDASQSDTTTLAEELERLELYLKLEHMRFKDKFRYTIAVDPAVDATQVRLPAMMLQPYVENSIWHGILPMGHQGHVEITVEPTTDADRVMVRIADDGIGVDESRKAKAGQENDHISRGIEITKGRADVLRRLELTDIRIDGPKQRWDLASQRSIGTEVTIELPVQQSVIKSAEGL